MCQDELIYGDTKLQVEWTKTRRRKKSSKICFSSRARHCRGTSGTAREQEEGGCSYQKLHVISQLFNSLRSYLLPKTERNPSKSMLSSLFSSVVPVFFSMFSLPYVTSLISISSSYKENSSVKKRMNESRENIFSLKIKLRQRTETRWLSLFVLWEMFSSRVRKHLLSNKKINSGGRWTVMSDKAA